VSRTEYVYVDVEVLRVSERAVLLRTTSGGGDQEWIPRSLCEGGGPQYVPGEEGKTDCIGIEEWKVDELGW